MRAEDSNEVLGVNTRMELAQLDAQLRAKKARELMLAGTTIFRPDTCDIDADVEIGTDTVIEPFVQLIGKTKIGADCRIRSYSVITNCEIGDKVLVRPGCILEDSVVRNGAQLGPYSHLRPGSDIGEGAHVGNFVETKKTRLGKGSKANHLTYLGDAEIGEGVNIGAGTITCNYDGVNKHQTIIDDGVFIGSDTHARRSGSHWRAELMSAQPPASPKMFPKMPGHRPRPASRKGRLGKRSARKKEISFEINHILGSAPRPSAHQRPLSGISWHRSTYARQQSDEQSRH